MNPETVSHTLRLIKILQAPPLMLAEIDSILDGQVRPRVAAPTGPMLMKMGEAAKHLGVSRATLWRMIQDKRLGKVEIMRDSYRVRRSDIDAIVAGRTAAS